MSKSIQSAELFHDLSRFPFRERPSCRPFLKWAGGKGSLLPELRAEIDRLPNKFQNYFEPFIGGGALFFELLPRHASLSDINVELINAYRIVQDRVGELIVDLGRHENTEEYFYRMRDLDRDSGLGRLSDVERASRFIYLNKTCFNGLHRVNSRGEFNVPFGSYKNPPIVDHNNLQACSEALRGVTLTCDSFDRMESVAQTGDFVYFDPPFAPLSKTASFTSYSKAGFNSDMQQNLRDLCVRLTERGVYVLVSNSHTPLILELYRGFNIRTVHAPRAINSRGDRRGKVEEVIISNY